MPKESNIDFEIQSAIHRLHDKIDGIPTYSNVFIKTNGNISGTHVFVGDQILYGVTGIVIEPIQADDFFVTACLTICAPKLHILAGVKRFKSKEY